MRSILDIFQGDSLIEGAPITLSDVTTTEASTDEEGRESVGGAAGESTPLIAGLAQQDTPDDNTLGWVPDPTIICD